MYFMYGARKRMKDLHSAGFICGAGLCAAHWRRVLGAPSVARDASKEPTRGRQGFDCTRALHRLELALDLQVVEEP